MPITINDCIKCDTTAQIVIYTETIGRQVGDDEWVESEGRAIACGCLYAEVACLGDNAIEAIEKWNKLNEVTDADND